MFSIMKRTLFAGSLLLAVASAPTVASAQNGVETFRVINHSSYRIDHMYVSPTSNTYWGNDQLGDDVLPPNYLADVSIVPGWYDVKVVDRDGDSCIVKQVDFREGGTWTVTDGLLLACEFFSHS
jgi:hypothetical protein